ncbi:Bacterial ABC transporter protein EcsB [Paenibacillus konkukensis]|uniref:Bacterial ABC transporter protein EcsB n=1 Tax=Paenibacillus konkukensis TaxID=2020716 RepID=A0ABY4RTJ7_9BACL|nr:ABC transporter permease [Paenibacillus konkukensis]UQZ85899.1 Bacterial ABC transporter protein EcsB [Paenibacillus konkukensis]
MDMKALYRRRTAGFLQEILPYLHYALQSASMAALTALLLFSIGYHLFLQWVTPAFPWQLPAAALMWIMLMSGKVRTYLQEADTLFLLPQEKGMALYLQAALQKALMLQLAGAIAAWLIVWPLYAKMTETAASRFVLLLLVWALFKAALVYGKWFEQQLQEPAARRWLTLLRWALSAFAAYVVIAFEPPYGILLPAAGLLLYLVCLRWPRKYPVHWMQLIDLEKRHRAAVYRILNWFIDVPQVQGKARNTRLSIQRWVKIPFRAESAYVYLYSIVWFRSELFGISLRITVIGVLLLLSVTGTWPAAVVYIVVALFSALQLSDLKRYYKEHLWQRIYPLPPELHKRSVGIVRRAVHLVILAILFVPAGFSMGSWLQAAGLLLLGGAASWLYHRYR